MFALNEEHSLENSGHNNRHEQVAMYKIPCTSYFSKHK